LITNKSFALYNWIEYSGKFENADKSIIISKIIQSSKSNNEVNGYLSLIKSISEKQKIEIINNTTLNIKKESINKYVSVFSVSVFCYIIL